MGKGNSYAVLYRQSSGYEDGRGGNSGRQRAESRKVQGHQDISFGTCIALMNMVV